MLNGKSQTSGKYVLNPNFRMIVEDFDVKKDSLKRKVPGEKIATHKKRLKTSKHNGKLSTAEEINQLHELSNISTDKLLLMKIDEIIKAAILPDKYNIFIEFWFNKFIKFISKLESEEEKQSSREIPWINKDIFVPMYNDSLNIPDFYFQFIKPKSIYIIGAQPLGTLINSNIAVDICIEMPRKCMQHDNYLNLVYHQKKALYLSYIAKKMKNWKYVNNLKFIFFKNDYYKPVLQLQPTSSLKKNIQIYLHIGCEQDTFKISRFLPSISNVRERLFVKNSKSTDKIISTPHYNNSILRDLTLQQNEHFLQSALNFNQNIKNGIILIKLWLQTKSMDTGYGGFTGYIVSMFTVYLLQKKKISFSMNTYEVIRRIWINIGNSSWHQQGISLHKHEDAPNQPILDEFHQYYDVVFLDFTGFNNICANLSLDIYLRVKEECLMAIKSVDTSNLNNLLYLFTTKLPIYTQFDHIINIGENADIPQLLQKHGLKKYQYDYCNYWYPHIVTLLTSVLRQGLSQRIRTIVPLTTEITSWNIYEKCPKIIPKVSFGLILNPDHALEVLDKGPQANEEEANDFRQFWGKKSELRRFPDGSITEACVWESPTSSLVAKRLVCKEITLYLLNYHFEIKSDQINYIANELDLAYQLDDACIMFDGGDNNAENCALAVIRSFDELGQNLRTLENTPLEITSVLGTSPVFRYCEIYPVLPQSHQFKSDTSTVFHSYRVNEGVIQFAASAKWPVNLGAIKRIKAAFYLHIANGLRTQFQLTTKANPESVEVIKDQFMFRFKISLQKEVALLKKEKTSKGVTKFKDTVESLRLEKDLFLMPKLTVSLHSLYQKHTSFGPTVLIAKRWLYSQLLDPFLWPDECTELLVASLYMQNTLPAPTQPQLGFFRFLYMLAHTDWKFEMILLNFSNLLSETEISDLESKFTTNRNVFPNMCIVTSCDTNQYSIWTKNAPCIEVMARVVLLSQYALNEIQQNIFSNITTSTKSLFYPSFEGYDVIIEVRKNHLHNSQLYDFTRNPKRKICTMDKSVPAADFEPVQYYLDALRKAYSDFAIFFYDPCGGLYICVLWKPEVFEMKDFEASAIYGYKQHGSKYRCNIEQIIEDFRIIGYGLVELITVNRSINEE